MGTISRQGTAPIEDGDSLDPAEIEAELVTIHGAINGGLDNANIAASAGIAGSKIDDDTITPSNVTSAVMSKAAVLADATGMTLSESLLTFTDFTGFDTGVTVTPGSTSDFIFMDFTFAIEAVNNADSLVYRFGFSVGGSDTAVLCGYRHEKVDVASSAVAPVSTIHVAWMVQAANTDATIIKPRYLSGNVGTEATIPATTYTSVLRAWVLAIKP